MKNLWSPVPWLCAICTILNTIYLHAQTSTKFLNKEWGLISENDGYALRYKDGYYTNGVYVHFSRVIDNNLTKENVLKKIRNILIVKICISTSSEKSFKKFG